MVVLGADKASEVNPEEKSRPLSQYVTGHSTILAAVLRWSRRLIVTVMLLLWILSLLWTLHLQQLVLHKIPAQVLVLLPLSLERTLHLRYWC